VSAASSSLPSIASLFAGALVWLTAVGCGGSAPSACDGDRGPLPSRARLACEAEWVAQAARPLDASLPGARTVKTIIDRQRGDGVHFMDTNAFPLHGPFARQHLGYAPSSPFVNEYFLPQRRFLLGSITHYEEPDVWAYEIAPYDTATPDMIVKAFRLLAEAAYFGRRLAFHPTSEEQVSRATELPAEVPWLATEQIFAGTSYQPLNLGETVGAVRLVAAADLASTHLTPREIAVLDRVPNEIGVVAGVVTAELQTPLSHVNVLSQQRGTPNMGLRNAEPTFAPYAGKWVRLVVGAFGWTLTEVTAAEAEAWWQAHRPTPTAIPAPRYDLDGILDVDDVTVADVGAVGGKVAGYGELRNIGGDVRVADALALPVSHYRRFMQQNGFDQELAVLLGDPGFQNDAAVRRAKLDELGVRMRAAPVDAALIAALEARLDAELPGMRVKLRSSTNAEDLERHTGAGLYESKAAQPHDPVDTLADALRVVWSSLWSFRAFEERAYAGIDQTAVAMGVLINPSYRDELANGVAVTANLFDPAPGGEDAFYVNAQIGEISVVLPDPNVVADQLTYYYFHNGQPATYYTRSNLIGQGETVLARSELFDLGRALAAIREHYSAIYQPPPGFGQLPMEVEWKVVADGSTGERKIWIKQARPHPGRGGAR
jgi:pyruvate, water dikinase